MSSASSSSSKPPHNRRSPKDESSDSENDDSSDEDSKPASGAEEEDEDAPVLSHKEQRRQKKKELKALQAASAATLSAKQKGKQPVKNSAELAPSKVPKRQNSIWVGNLAFKTTADALRRWRAGAGGGWGEEGESGVCVRRFRDPDAKTIAITLSENPLDGRRLLIKDDQPPPQTPATQALRPQTTATSPDTPKPHKDPARPEAARRAHAIPGQPGFETTGSPSAALRLASAEAPPPPPQMRRRGCRSKRDVDTGEKPWIRKVRLGTFEDSGKCKGAWAFVDFTSTEHATSGLVNQKNHFLDGRTLVVEYASPDAVRRGGNIPRSKDPNDKNGYAKARERQGKMGRTHQRDDASSPQRKRKTGGEEDAGADADAEPDADGENASPKRRRVEDGTRTSERGTAGKGGKPPRARPKPGAALALAKRETAAIVPAQGRKIVF
ncbi:uncharacterized protein B0H18DRAFT_1112462 [Fomitopsis serialis]|uniref:uncharacterized protein n=1 Tax=Fomitopsis serialis TaxID=139415 RepID=UPI002007CF16|nr:uncharacterized protein B0H18DRAFT_1112462 [Neoantrodia serialis]KAH9938287.1 hypothetical protein B0H18DRAFT_1112462 [Neoantrodia serialis]